MPGAESWASQSTRRPASEKHLIECRHEERVQLSSDHFSRAADLSLPDAATRQNSFSTVMVTPTIKLFSCHFITNFTTAMNHNVHNLRLRTLV